MLNNVHLFVGDFKKEKQVDLAYPISSGNRTGADLTGV